MSDTYVVDSKGRPVIIKDPNAVLDYSWDWTDWLEKAAFDKIVAPPVISVIGGITAGAIVRDGTRGTAVGYKADGAAYAVGATSITLQSGSGTILSSDLVTIDGDLDENGNPNLYPVSVGIAAPGAITLLAPGIQKAISSGATPIIKPRALVTVMLSAGTASKNPLPSATCRVNTFQLRTDDRTIYFTIKDR